MLLVILGIYYIVAAKAELRPIFIWSVPLRVVVMVFFLAFVLFGLAPTVLLIFAGINVACALWTWSALWSKESKRPAHAA